MTRLTIGTVSIFSKEYNTLVINSINTITSTSSVSTSINYFITNSPNPNSPNPNIINGSGYRDTIILDNPSSVEYNYLVGQLLSITGLTASN